MWFRRISPYEFRGIQRPCPLTSALYIVIRAAVAMGAALAVALARLGVHVGLPAAVLASQTYLLVVAAAVSVGGADGVALAVRHPVIHSASTNA